MNVNALVLNGIVIGLIWLMTGAVRLLLVLSTPVPIASGAVAQIRIANNTESLCGGVKFMATYACTIGPGYCPCTCGVFLCVEHCPYRKPVPDGYRAIYSCVIDHDNDEGECVVRKFEITVTNPMSGKKDVYTTTAIDEEALSPFLDAFASAGYTDIVVKRLDK